MIWLLLACGGQPAEAPAEEREDPRPPPRTHDRLRSLPLPDAVPFTARTRTQPLTLVDERGQPSLVVEALGVEVRVERLLADRAYVICTGCRAEVSGWFQRQGLLVAETADPAGLSRDEALVAWMSTQDAPVLAHGVVRQGTSWTAPPWHAEGGYAGPVAAITWSPGGPFALSVTVPPAE